MSGGAYRPEPPSSPADEELERVAAEGQRRILEAQAAGRRQGDEKDRERHVRVALGGHYYGPFVRASAITLVVVGATAVAAAAFVDVDAVGWGASALFGGLLLLLWTPRATRARVEAEKAWVGSLPFAMAGYFDVLGAEPALGMNLVVSIVWREGLSAPSGTLQGVLGVLDADARVLACDAAGARVRSGSISGWTGLRTRGFVHRNTRLVGYVHRLVEEVLLPLDRAGRLGRVSLGRE